jgi:hypothetical protein
MSYLKRCLERKFLKLNTFFKAVLVTGARHAGKTTMLRRLAEGQNAATLLCMILLRRQLNIGCRAGFSPICVVGENLARFN